MITSDIGRGRRHIESVKRWPRQAGKADYLRFLQGEKLTRAEAIKSKCYECNCGQDTEPCLVETCPLQPYCQWNDDDPAEPT